MTARARLRKRSVVVAATGFVWLGITACELVLPTHELVALDASPNGTSGGAADRCQHALPPPKPPDETPGTVDLLFAVRSLRLSGDASVGLDLDRTCTCPAPPSCVPPLPGQAQNGNCDPPDNSGRDIKGNAAFGEVMETVLRQAPAGDIDQRIAVGLLSYVLQIKHYKPAGASTGLFVAFYDSSGLLGVDDGGLTRSAPTWDGGEGWALDCALSQTSGCPNQGELIGNAPLIPGFYDPEAYVTKDRMLVANINPVVIGFSLATLRLTHATIVAKLTEAADGTITQIDGQIAGRLARDDIFATVSMLKDNGGQASLCPGNGQFETLRESICQTLDLPAGPALQSDVCDALSFAIPFTALPARFGIRLDHIEARRGCDATVRCAE